MGLDAVSRAGVDDVVHGPVPDPPGPHRRGRAGQAASRKSNDLIDPLGRCRRFACDADGPSTDRWRSSDGDITAEADEDAARDPVRDGRGSPIGGQGLGGCTEVEADAAWDADGQIRPIELHMLIAGHRAQSLGRRRRTRLHLVQVGVVTQRGDGVADSGIDGAAAAFGRVHGNSERVEEEGAHRHRPSGLFVEPLQLRVSSKPAARDIDGVELFRQDLRRGINGHGILHHDRGTGAEGAERALCQDGFEHIGRPRHREVPPDVTAGDEELDVGVCEEDAEDEDDEGVPVLPVVPELEAAPSDVVAEVDPDVEDVDPDFDVPDVPDVPVVPVVAFVLLAAVAPGRSCATTIPIATVAPVAAMTAPRVRTRSRLLALSVSAYVFGLLGGDMRLLFLGWWAPRRPLPHHARIDPVAGHAVVLL